MYHGQIRGDNVREGYGIQLWTDGNKYDGYWKDDKAHGKGKFYYNNGDYFEGDWVQNVTTGYGVFVNLNGNKYEGQWLNDIQNGEGKETWKDGTIFEG